MKYIKILIAIALLAPSVTYGAFAVGFNATTTTNPIVTPNRVNGADPIVMSPIFLATSTTATSTFANGLNLTGGCFSFLGTCISATGSNLWAANGNDIYNTNSGDVGIGTTSPYAKLSIVGTAVGTTTLAIRPVTSQTANIIDIYTTGGSLNSVVTSSGNWGISSTSPFATFAINPTAGNASNQFVVGSSTATSFVIDNSGMVGVGVSNLNQTTYDSTIPQVQVVGTSANASLSITRYSNNSLTPRIILSKSRGTSSGTFSVLQNGDQLGRISFTGDDGTDIDTPGAYIQAIVSGTPALNSMPSALQFFTHNGTSIAEKMRITPTGLVGIGTTTPISKLGIQDTAGAFITLNSSDTALIDGDILGGLDFYSLDTSTGMSGVWGKIRYEADSTWDGTVDDGADLIFSARTVADGSLQDKMVLKASGNVGIGTTTPDRLLTVSGATSATTTIETRTANTTPGLEFRSNVTGNNVNIGNISFNNSNGNSTLANIVGFQGSSAVQGALIFSTRNSTGFAERMRIDTTGNIGIGTTSPWGLLSVTNTGTNPSFVVEDSTSPDTTPFIIDASGNVGIGISTPLYKLDVDGSMRLGASSGSVQPILGRNTSGGLSIDSTGAVSSSNNLLTVANNGGTALVTVLGGGNVGIGTTSPSTGLHIDSGSASLPSITLSAAGGSVQTIGRASASFTGGAAATDLGIRYSNKLWLGNSSTASMVVDSSGNVGIGTTSPLSKLSIQGSGATSATSALNVTDSTGKTNLYVRDDGVVGIGVLAPTATLDVRSTNTSVASFYLTNGTNRTGLTVSVDTAATNHITTLSSTGSFTGGFAFNTGATEAMRINTSGNVGIGTSTINTITRLALDGTSTSGTWQSISNGSVGGKNYWIGSTGSSNGSGVGKFAIYDVDNASYRFILDGSGNVGIGTTTPNALLAINPNGISTDVFVIASSTGNKFVVTNGGFVGISVPKPLVGLSVNTTNTLGSASTLVGSVDIAAGRIGIGGSLYSYGSVCTGGSAVTCSGSGGVVLGGTNATALTNFPATGNSFVGNKLGISTTSPSYTLSVGGSSYLGGEVYATSTVTFTGLTGATGGTNQDVCIDASGVLINETTGTCVVSSERFKNNIVPLKIDGLSKILKLKPIEYSYNEDDVSDYKDRQYGFTAEAVAKVDPHFAKYGTDGLPRTLDDRALLAASVKAIQELKAEVDSLKAEVKLLKSNKK